MTGKGASRTAHYRQGNREGGDRTRCGRDNAPRLGAVRAPAQAHAGGAPARTGPPWRRQGCPESRGRADDYRDRKMLDHLRQRRLIELPLHIDHLVGRHEPMLWVPDAVCGMVSNLRTGNSTYYDFVRSRVTLHQVALPSSGDIWRQFAPCGSMDGELGHCGELGSEPGISCRTTGPGFRAV